MAKSPLEIQLVELHFQDDPQPAYAAMKLRVEAILGDDLDSSPPHDARESFLLFHKNNTVTCAEGKLPAQTAILAAHQPIDLEAYADEIQQSWFTKDARSLLENSQHTLLVAEMMAQAFEPADRLRLFHGVLQAVIEVTRPAALVFKHSQQVVDPSDYLAKTDVDLIQRPGSLNVRFFNISNSEGDKIMDTLGLYALGLHDLQCHFRQLSPQEVSRVLLNAAIYIFENGPVIKSGNTIAGVGPGSKWVCQFEDSLLEPIREILDLNPGQPFAAGGRH